MPSPREVWRLLYAEGAPFRLFVQAGPDAELPPYDQEGPVPLAIEPNNPRNHHLLDADDEGLVLRVAQRGRPYRVVLRWDDVVALVQGDGFAAVWEREPLEEGAPHRGRPPLRLVE